MNRGEWPAEALADPPRFPFALDRFHYAAPTCPECGHATISANWCARCGKTVSA